MWWANTTYHQQYDAPLTSDIESLARPMSHWVHRIAAPQAVGKDTARAVGEALRKPGQVATLILPADCAWGELPKDTRPVQARLLAAPAPDVQHIEHVARAMLRAIQAEEQVVLFLGHRRWSPKRCRLPAALPRPPARG
jgi:acetolactate synthase-1/2/3 large subunit